MNEDLKLQTFEALKKRKKPIVRTLTLVTDEDTAEMAERLEREVARLNLLIRGGDDRYQSLLEEKQDELSKCRTILKETAIVLTFQSIGRKPYDDLVSKHPPSEEQKAEIKAEGGDPNALAWNIDTFPPALVAASLIDPVVNEDEANEMLNGSLFNNAESTAILATAMEVNTSRKIFDLGNV